MKYKLFIFIFAVFLTMAGCNSGTPASSTIGPGNWTIKDPVRYDFDCKKIAPFGFCPTLTLGSNGSMLYVQLFGDTTGLTFPKGLELSAKVIMGNDTLKVLERPTQDTLMKLNGASIGIWYFDPLKKGQSVNSLEFAYKGGTISWPFSEAKRLNP